MSINTAEVNLPLPVAFETAPNSGANDAYGRLRTSTPYTLFDSTQTSTFDCQKIWDAVIWDNQNSELPVGDPGGSPAVSPFVIGGTVTGPNGSSIGVAPSGVDQNSRMVPITLSNNYSAARAIIQSKEYMPFLSGKSAFICYSGVFAPQVTPVDQEVRIVARTSVSGSVDDSTYSALQANWNIDKLDGSGASGVTLDFSKVQVVMIDAQMLSGRIRVGFTVGGMLYYAHEFNTTNVSALPTMQTFSLPMRYELSNQATVSSRATSRCGYFDSKNGVFLEISDDFVGGIAKIHMKDSSVFSEAGEAPGLYQNNAVTELVAPISLPSSLTYTPILSIRPKQVFNGFENRSRIFPIGISVATAGNNPVEIAFRRAGAMNGTFVDAGATKSYEINRTMTTITGGHDADGSAISPGGGSTGSQTNAGQVDYKTANVMAKVDRYITLQKPLTVIARAPQGTASITIAVLNNAELYF